MKCENIREEFMEVVLNGRETASPEVHEHLQSCATCADELTSLRQTMLLLDEWQAPEPSPYFTPRLKARVRDEATVQPSGWLAWLRRPVVAAAAMVLVAVGVGMLEMGQLGTDRSTLANNGDSILRNVSNSPSAAVGDLQYLDKNADLFSDFDALDGQSSTE
jgi:anti-sigma factor RsiW